MRPIFLAFAKLPKGFISLDFINADSDHLQSLCYGDESDTCALDQKRETVAGCFCRYINKRQRIFVHHSQSLLRHLSSYRSHISHFL